MASDLEQKKNAPVTPPGSGNGALDSKSRLNCSSNFSPCSSSASAACPWGTWEDLLLASAVLRHGVDDWTSVSFELQTRAFLVPPSLFSAEACKGRFWILDGRFSSCNSSTFRDGKIPWFEEVRKLRVAQLKRELERYDSSIGLLEQKLKRLKARNVGIETVDCRDHHKPDNGMSTISQGHVSQFQDSSTCDQLPGDISLGTVSRISTGSTQSSHLFPTVIAEGEMQDTMLASGLKDSVTVKNADLNLSFSAQESFDTRQCCSIFDHNPSPSCDKKSDLEAHQISHKSKFLPCIVHEKNSVEPQDTGIESHDVTTSSKLSYLTLELEDVHEPFMKEKRACGGCNQDLNSLDRVVLSDNVCTDKVSESGLEVSCERADLNSFTVDVDKTKDVKCTEIAPSSATTLADNVVEEGNRVEDATASTSAMDLLRIAYTDGTPVSTPEDTENVILEPVRPEKSENSGNKERFCESQNGLASCKPGLFSANKDGVSCQGKVVGPQKIEDNKTLGSEIPVHECLKGSKEAFLTQSEMVCSLEWEHSAEKQGHEVTSACEESNRSIFSDSCLESTVAGTKMRQIHDQVGGYCTANERACSSLPSLGAERDSSFITKPKEGNRGKGIGSNSLDCHGRLAKDVNEIAKATPCLEMDEVKSEEQSNDTVLSDVNSLSKIESDVKKFRELELHMFGQNVHSAANALDGECGRQPRDCGMQPEIEKMESSGPSTYCLNGTSVLGEVSNLACDPSHLHRRTLSCQSISGGDEANQSFKLNKRKQESGSFFAKRKSLPVEKLASAKKACWKALDERASPEGASKIMLTSSCPRNDGATSPYKANHRADIDVFEEDGLLVDLIKLKDSDLTTLRKRKYLGRCGFTAKKHNNKGLSQTAIEEVLVHKYPKVSRCEESIKNKSILHLKQKKSPYKEKSLECCPGSYAEQEGFSSNTLLQNSFPKSGSKESAVGVFATRKSRLKVRRREPQVKEFQRIKKEIAGSVQSGEGVALEAAEAVVREPAFSSVGPTVDAREARADNDLLPDFLILLESLRKISGHRFGLLFKTCSEEQTDTRYRDQIKKPMDLNTVRSKLEEGTYLESLEFFRDMMLIFTNALVFHPRDSQEYNAAQALRENLIREMDGYLREVCVPGSLASTRAVEFSNISCSETISNGKGQAPWRSFCGPLIEDLAVDSAGEEATSVASIAAQDMGLETNICFKESNSEKINQGNPRAIGLLTESKMARSRAHIFEVDRPDLEKSGREKRLRSSDYIFSNLSMKRRSISSSQGAVKTIQASSRTCREFVSIKGSSDKIMRLKESNENVDWQKSEKGVYTGRYSRRTQQSKQSSPQEIQLYCKPQRRART